MTRHQYLILLKIWDVRTYFWHQGPHMLLNSTIADTINHGSLRHYRSSVEISGFWLSEKRIFDSLNKISCVPMISFFPSYAYV